MIDFTNTAYILLTCQIKRALLWVNDTTNGQKQIIKNKVAEKLSRNQCLHFTKQFAEKFMLISFRVKIVLQPFRFTASHSSFLAKTDLDSRAILLN